MSSNTRDKILNADDIKTKLVPIPEWDVKVEVRSMNADLRTKNMNAVHNGGVDFRKHYPELIIECTYDPETGERLFDAADRDTLLTKNGSAIQRLVDAITDVSNFDEEAAEATFRGESVD